MKCFKDLHGYLTAKDQQGVDIFFYSKFYLCIRERKRKGRKDGQIYFLALTSVFAWLGRN